MKRQWRILLAAAMSAFLLLTATACGGDEEEEEGADLPVQYVFGEETVDVVLPAVDGQCTIEQTEEQTVYTYTPLGMPGGDARLYYDMVLKPEIGFSLIDENGYISQDMPDFTQPSGIARYARASSQEGYKLLLSTEWKEETCIVTLKMEEGQVMDPPGEGMTIDEALDYFRKLPPSELGLEGTTMDDYEVYSASGAVFVHGVPCQKIQVYSRENLEHTNHLVATYLMNGDATRLYRLNDDDTVTALR